MIKYEAICVLGELSTIRKIETDSVGVIQGRNVSHHDTFSAAKEQLLNDILRWIEDDEHRISENLKGLHKILNLTEDAI